MAIFHILVVLSIWVMLWGAAAGDYYLISAGAISFIILAGVAIYADDTELQTTESEEST